MEKSRGKKGKKTRWQVTLGLKETTFAGIGMVGLMVLSFALGTLAGRGEIYRLAYSWGLLAPEPTKMAQFPPAGVPVAPPESPPEPATAPGAPQVATVAKTPSPAPVTGSVAPLPTASLPTAQTSKKKPKTKTGHRENKSREEELRKVRQEVVRKLKFQNSFDSGPKPSKVAHKPKESGKTKTRAATPKLLRVAEYRNSKTAKDKVAALQKKGVKATLKQTQDSQGTRYTVYQQASGSAPAKERPAQKRTQGNGSTRKPKSE